MNILSFSTLGAAGIGAYHYIKGNNSDANRVKTFAKCVFGAALAGVGYLEVPELLSKYKFKPIDLNSLSETLREYKPEINFAIVCVCITILGTYTLYYSNRAIDKAADSVDHATTTVGKSVDHATTTVGNSLDHLIDSVSEQSQGVIHGGERIIIKGMEESAHSSIALGGGTIVRNDDRVKKNEDQKKGKEKKTSSKEVNNVDS